MELSAKELRIGNLINKGSFEGWKVTVSDIYNIQLNHKLGRYEPIQLTEEWLLKFFTLSRFNQWVNEKMNFTHIVEVLNIEIKYVHQLQNFYFALTGEELTIK